MEPSWPELVRRNLADVQARIAAAARRAGRAADDVTLVGVTKYVSAEVARELFAAGCTNLGESRPQELWAKREALSELPIRWHLIGHLQRNKAKRTAPLLERLHSLESRELAGELSRAATESGAPLRALVEINVSGDASKHGIAPAEAGIWLRELRALPGLEIRGLMTMAHREGGPEVAREDFRRLRELRDRLKLELGEPAALPELSMGMSDDFEVAIEEGATLVRVGSALFEGLE